MWERTHQPRTLDEVAMRADQRRTFLTYVSSQDMPDLMLLGPPGHGKSTIAALLEQELAFEAHVINAGGQRGIDIIREVIEPLTRTSQGTDSLSRVTSSNPGAPFRRRRSLSATTRRHREHGAGDHPTFEAGHRHVS